MPIHHGNWVRFTRTFSVGSGTEALTLIDDQHFGCFPPIERGFT